MKPTLSKLKKSRRLKTFEVDLHFMQFSRAKVTIEAKDLAEAQAKAEDITADQVDDWNPYDGEIDVQGVQAVVSTRQGKAKK